MGSIYQNIDHVFFHVQEIRPFFFFAYFCFIHTGCPKECEPLEITLLLWKHPNFITSRSGSLYYYHCNRTSIACINTLYMKILIESYCKTTYARILKAHSHSKSGSSIWASLECQCCFWIAGGLVSYLTMWLLTL
jgi:hypothetical protein